MEACRKAPVSRSLGVCVGGVDLDKKRAESWIARSLKVQKHPGGCERAERPILWKRGRRGSRTGKNEFRLRATRRIYPQEGFFNIRSNGPYYYTVVPCI